MSLFDPQGVHQRHGGPGLKVVQRLVVGDRPGPPEVGQVHHDTPEVLRQGGQYLVKGDPAGGAGAVGMEHDQRVTSAHIMVVDVQTIGGYRVAGAFLGDARNRRHATSPMARK